MARMIAQNKKARHEYFIEDAYEAGIVLSGTEVKSIRAGKVNLKDSYVQIKNGEAFVIGMHISPYEKGNIFNKDPLRTRKLLLRKREISKLHDLTMQQGYTLIPLDLHFEKSYVKMNVGVARGKKLHDKRDSDKQKSDEKKMRRALRGQY
jgi:SsrA-binding protein